MERKPEIPTTIDEALDYANESLILYGDTLLSMDELQDIYRIYLEFEALKKRGITTHNYGEKVKSFFKKRKELLNDFDLFDPNHKAFIPEYYPVSNPNQLLIQMKAILVNAGLNVKQIQIFFKDALDAGRSPDNEDVDNYLTSIFTSITPSN